MSNELELVARALRPDVWAMLDKYEARELPGEPSPHLRGQIQSSLDDAATAIAALAKARGET